MGVWFRAKRYGIGAGLPLTWQGWAVYAAYVGGVAAIATALEGGARVLALLLLTSGLVRIVMMRTEGGWHWRWGRR